MFSIYVKIDSIESRKKNTGLLHIILALFLVLKSLDYYNYINYASIVPIVPVLIVAGLSLYYAFFRKKLFDGGRYNFWLRLLQVATFSVFGLAMLRVGRPLDYYGLFLWAFLSLILLFSERRIFNDTILYLTKEGIKVPGNYKDVVIPWSNISDVVVRHDFITIFHEEKKYLQYQVMQPLSELELVKMNAFCREELGVIEKVEGTENEEG
jgi:hypothetical protein